jgi:hypothetical protein
MLTNYVSIKQTIGRFLKDLGLADTAYVDDIPQWTEDAVQIMEISNYYTYRYKMVKVEEYKAMLPCDHENIYGFWVANGFGQAQQINNLRRLFIRNSPLFGAGIFTDNRTENIYGVPKVNINTSTPCVAQYASINGGVAHTSFRQGWLYIVYSGIPIDCDGFPLVPKDAKVQEALQYWFIYKMSLSGYVHPVVNRTEAYQMWERLYPRAANSVNWMSLQEYQEFTELWTNVLMGDLNANNYIH